VPGPKDDNGSGLAWVVGWKGDGVEVPVVEDRYEEDGKFYKPCGEPKYSDEQEQWEVSVKAMDDA